MTLGERIKHLRLINHLSKKDLSESLGISYVQISKYENNSSYPSIPVIKKLAQTLNTTYDYLLDGTDRKEYEEKIIGLVTSKINMVPESYLKSMYQNLNQYFNFSELISHELENVKK